MTSSTSPAPAAERPRLKKKVYERELRSLQEELARLQWTIRERQLKVVVLFAIGAMILTRVDEAEGIRLSGRADAPPAA